MKNNLILGGWIGFIVGMILLLASSDGMDSIGPGMAAATVTILYGYTSGYLIEAGLEKWINIVISESPTFVGFFVCGMMGRLLR